MAVRNLLEATRLTSAFVFLGTLVSFLNPHHLWKCWISLRQTSCVAVIADILGLIIGLMIGAVRLVKGTLKFGGRFILAMASDPTANDEVPLAIPVSSQNANRSTTSGGSSEAEAKPPDPGIANGSIRKPMDLAGILQVIHLFKYSLKKIIDLFISQEIFFRFSHYFNLQTSIQ